MPSFLEVLETHFRFKGQLDSTPHDLKPRRKGQGCRALLALTMRDLGYRVGVEIGTRHGESAAMWCENIPGLRLTCIDPYGIYRKRQSQEKQDAVYEVAKKRLAPFNVEFVRESSLDVIDRFADGSLDFVHIDGNHSFDIAVQDIIKYVPKVRKGGMVLVHDYFDFFEGGVRQAVDGYTTCHVIRPWFVTHEAEPTAFWERGVEQVP